MSLSGFCIYSAPNVEGVEGAYWFRVICASICHTFLGMPYLMNRASKGFEISFIVPHGQIVDTRLFFSSELSLFLELCPFEKIRMKSDACHIL